MPPPMGPLFLGTIISGFAAKKDPAFTTVGAPWGPRSMIYMSYLQKYVVFHEKFDSGIDLSEFSV